MDSFLPTIILRHRRENLKKCSLSGLESRLDMQFFTYPIDHTLPPLSDYILLSLDAPVLSDQDQNRGLFLIDATWRYAKMIASQVVTPLKQRSLPPELETSYPRRQTDCSDPNRGLASAEALYTAYLLTGRNPKGLLDHYYWKGAFLQKNAPFFKKYQLND